jgi:hypothetical protein
MASCQCGVKAPVGELGTDLLWPKAGASGNRAADG